MGEIIYPFGAPKSQEEPIAQAPETAIEEEKSFRSANKKEIRRIIQKLDSLPSLPSVAGKILSLLTEEDPDLNEVVRLVESDQAVTLRLLRMANSAAIGSRIASVSRAILMLGFTQIRCLLLSIAISESLIKSLKSSYAKQQVSLWKHCLGCAVAAEMIAEYSCPKYKTEAFVAGLVHDIGKLVLEESLPEKYIQVREAHGRDGLSWLEAEQAVLGVDHATVGKWLAEKWGLPEVLTHVIWLHHHPASAIAELDFVSRKEVVLAVKLGSSLAHTIMADSPAAYRDEPDHAEILSSLHLKADALRDVSSSLGRRYSERVAIFDIEEDELSFYFQALQRANKELSRLALKSERHKAMEQANIDLRKLHELQAKLSSSEDFDEVFVQVSHLLRSHFEKREGMIYFVDASARKLIGRSWTNGKKLLFPISIDLDADGRPVSDIGPPVDGLMNKLVKTRNSRFLKYADDAHVNNLQCCDPYLIQPLVIGDSLAGEIIFVDDASREASSAPLTSVDIQNYGCLASIAASALAYIQSMEKREEVSESLSAALQKNARVLSHLKLAMQRYECLFEYSNDVVVLHDLEGKILRANQRAVELLGYAQEEFGQLSMLRLLPMNAPDGSTDAVKTMWQNEQGGRLEVELQHKDGRLIDADISSRIVDVGSGMVQSIIRDVSRRKQGERALAAEKDRLAVTLRSIGVGVIATNKTGNVILINGIAEELTGFGENEAINRSLTEIFRLVHPKTKQQYMDLIEQVREETGLEIESQPVLISRNGDERVVSVSFSAIRNRQGDFIGIVLIFKDETENLKMEKEIAKAQKMESIGVLAGGIAHDFNNILSAIIGNLSLAKMVMRSGGDAAERLEEAEKASYRAKNLTEQLLSFSRGGAPVRKTASIADIIKDSASFMLSGSNVRCELHVPEDLWPVEVDEGQISQVISNMALNAQQAMPNGGVVVVRAENVNDVEAPSHLGVKKSYVRISIEDQGVGISEEDLQKIFDPYFTTKSEGTGLGLATSYSIIANHEGRITVESKEGEGTVFHIYIPASPREIVLERPLEITPASRKGKILIMDDEESVRTTLGMMLSYVGYEVECAGEGSEAVAFYENALKRGERFDVVLMDLTVPGGMGGGEAMKRLLELDKNVNAIISSGYFHDPIIANYREYGFKAAITKPFRMEELERILPRVLDGKIV
jgi:PAS domain S-box-containing protein